MKFQPDTARSPLVARYDADEGVLLTMLDAQGQPFAQTWRSSFLLAARTHAHAWSAQQFSQLTEADFALLLAHTPQVIVFGSGAQLRFPAPALLRPLIQAGIGIETMNNPAACRTYNVLAAEGRAVVLALLMENTVA